MFDKEFFPTPEEVLFRMQFDCKNKIVLEPSAGKGDIIDFCKLHGAKEVLAIELNKDLQQIVKTKAKLIGENFLLCTALDITHINMIVMNPPFSNADEHILHAWEIAPEGTEIVSLCNYNTLDNDYTKRRQKLLNTIKEYGFSDNLGPCFDNAERKTGIDIGLVRLFKPVVSSEFNFDGFCPDQDEEEIQENGMMQYDEIRALVNRYVGAMKTFDELRVTMDALNYTLQPINMSGIGFSVGYNERFHTKEEFGKIVQINSWNFIFEKLNMQKYVTSGVMKDIRKFIEIQQKYPFTVRNVHNMLNTIIGTSGEKFNQALTEVIDNFTKHTHENRYGVEGWKTNEGHLLNQKFIIDYMVETSYQGNPSLTTRDSNQTHLTDLTKVLCHLTGKVFDDIIPLRFLFNINDKCFFDGDKYLDSFHEDPRYTNPKIEEYQKSLREKGINYTIKRFKLEFGTWFDWGFFECKVFKKGTMHLKFKNIDDWYILNQRYGSLKGFVLPETSKK